MKTFRRLPYVYHIADMWPESVVESGMLGRGVLRNVAEKAINAWCNALYRNASAVTVLSEGFKRLLTDRGVPAEKVEVVYNWTQEEVFHPVPRDEVFARELGLHGKFNVIYAGNIGAFQGIDTVVRAASLLLDYPEIQFVVAGTGQKDSEIRELAASIGVTNVKFLGSRPYVEMPRINALADVLLVHLMDLPFFASTIPSKTQVSLASGRPVLMAVRGDAAAMINRAEAGVSVPPEDSSAMADAVLRLYRAKPCEREAMGARGREFYLNEMSLEVGGTKMEEIFEKVAGSR